MPQASDSAVGARVARGTRFLRRSACAAAVGLLVLPGPGRGAVPATRRPDILVADFEGSDYGDWRATGQAFGSGPARGTLPRQNPVSGFLGEGLVNTYLNGDGTTGTLTSPPFAIQRRYVNFLVGGGGYPDETCLYLLVDGSPVRMSTGPIEAPGGTEQLSWCTWDVSAYAGRTAVVRIVDEARGGWGHVNVDQIVQSDQAKAAAVTAVYEGDVLLADFEGEGFGDWLAVGDSFGAGPASVAAGTRGQPSGYRGQRFVDGRHKGDRSVGTLTSPEFTVERAYINFLIGGGNWPGLACANLLVEGRVARSSTANDQEPMVWATWDVRGFLGQTARIEVVDRHTGYGGHVSVDHFVQSHRAKAHEIQGDPMAARREATRTLRELGAGEIIFAVRKVDGDGHWYANLSYWSSNPKRTLYHDGGRLCRLNVATGAVTPLVDDPTGGVRDPQVHYDGAKVLFSYRKGGQPFYHLYEIGTDGTGLRQLTEGPYDDIEPTYLPDGGIAFCSTRCNRMVNCYFVRVAVIFRCDGNGGNIRQLSSNIEQDNTPWVLPDGRILHQRWEYIDRSQVAYHHLWTMNPDGTNQMVYFGNLSPSTVMIDAKPIPGTSRVVASFSPGHGQKEHAGRVTVVDVGMGPDHRPSARAISGPRLYRDPYPLGTDCFLVAGSTDVLLMDGAGQTTPLYQLSEADCVAGLRLHEPRPLRPRRRERVIPPRVNTGKGTGRVFCVDVRAGRNMTGVEPGEIKELLVLEALPKPVNFSGGWEPITYGGSFTLERILGTVPVEADGSAHMELPALRSLFFVALDRDGMAVKRMQSFLTVQPGEVFGCVGCHEQRVSTSLPGRKLAAMRRPPSQVRPIPGIPEVIDFPRDVQPILDRHCVACHDYRATEKGGPRSGGVVLCGDRGPHYSQSYVALTVRQQISDGRNAARSNYAPRELGSAASPLLAKIDGSHHRVVVTPKERQLLRLWIDSAAAYPGTYAALGAGMTGGQGWDKRTDAVLERRCGECHSGALVLPKSPGDTMGESTSGRIDPKHPRTRFSRHLAYNLTRPEMSLLLLAPLAKEAGGYGTCRRAGQDDAAPVFATTDDPDYKILLAAVEATKAHLEQIKRFDMPGFRPNRHYVREMTFYGVLPEGLGEEDPVDVYAIDEAYWRSLWYRPAAD